jgi:lipopolysaccharide transport system permease protein
LATLPRSVIEPESGWQPIDLAELWRYRELLHFFAWRDVKVRYKQTELGIAWAVLEPLLTVGVFTLLFQVLLGKGSEPGVAGVPYVLSTFCAMLPWQLFSESSARSSESLLTGQNLVTKVYFPRMVLPLAAVATALVDFGILFVVLAVMMACCGIAPTWTVLTLPLFVILAVAASLAVGLWLSALSAIYRDFRYAQPVLIRLGMFISPVIFVSSVLEEKLPHWAILIYGLNPMVAVIEGFRWALLPGADPLKWAYLPSVLMTAVLLVSGMYFFRRMERTIADVI